MNHKIVAIATLILALVIINFSIYQKETLMKDGLVVFLKLAPVDPRSLMQGDYMALRFEIANQIQSELIEKQLFETQGINKQSYDGLINVHLDENSVASFGSILTTDNDRSGTVMQFRLRKGVVKFATNAYFFEEGTGQKLEAAEYGEFRVSKSGELLLVSLRDKDLNEFG